MPSNQIHVEHTIKKLGIEASDLHSWMDAPSQWLGPNHRRLRHDTNDAPSWAIEKYGEKTTKMIMSCHIQLDLAQSVSSSSGWGGVRQGAGRPRTWLSDREIGERREDGGWPWLIPIPHKCICALHNDAGCTPEERYIYKVENGVCSARCIGCNNRLNFEPFANKWWAPLQYKKRVKYKK